MTHESAPPPLTHTRTSIMNSYLYIPTLQVSSSLKSRLFIGGIPSLSNVVDLVDALNRSLDPQLQIMLPISAREAVVWQTCKPFAFLEFENHVLASLARDQLHSVQLHQRPLNVEWAKGR